MNYRTYHIAELLPQALHELSASSLPGRPEDRPPVPTPAAAAQRTPGRAARLHAPPPREEAAE